MLRDLLAVIGMGFGRLAVAVAVAVAVIVANGRVSKCWKKWQTKLMDLKMRYDAIVVAKCTSRRAVGHSSDVYKASGADYTPLPYPLY